MENISRIGVTVEKKEIPFVRIDFSIPQNEDFAGENGIVTPTNKLSDFLAISLSDRQSLNKSYNIPVYLYPTSSDIWAMNPEIYLFRDVSRKNKNRNNTFRRDGRSIVHPQHIPVPGVKSVGHRLYGGESPNVKIPRITEKPLDITNDFYGGTAASPNGTYFPFQPLTWFPREADLIDAADVKFPIYISELDGNTEGGGLKDYNTNVIYKYAYSGHNMQYTRRSKKTFVFYFGLMVDNPEYDGGTKIAKKILVSNLEPFTLGYLKVPLVNDVDGTPPINVRQIFAIDWKLYKGKKF